jgi:hypothetical protein
VGIEPIIVFLKKCVKVKLVNFIRRPAHCRQAVNDGARSNFEIGPPALGRIAMTNSDHLTNPTKRR